MFGGTGQLVLFWYVKNFQYPNKKKALVTNNHSFLQLIWHSIATYFFTKFQQIPFVKKKVDQEVTKVLDKIEDDLIDRSLTYYTKLPESGWSPDRVTQELEKYVLNHKYPYSLLT